jgi:alginate O-acetyltransferase complex protein AlgJ
MRKSSASSWPRVVADMILTSLFLLSIGLPFADMLLGLDGLANTGENRRLAAAPSIRLNAASLQAFPEALKLYIQDHFGFRARLVRWNAIIKVMWLDVSSNRDVLLGKKGWLFYAGDQNVDDYRCTKPFTAQDLLQWGRVLEAQRRWCEAHGSRFLFVVPPNPHSIYPELLPDSVNRVGAVSRLDQLLRHLREQTKVEVVDFREALLAAKPDGNLYFKTDTHWSPFGARVGSREVARRLQLWFPRIHSPGPEAYREIKRPYSGGLAGMLGLSGVLRERAVFLEPYGRPAARINHASTTVSIAETADRNLPRAVMVCDSYGVVLMPYLSELFSRIVFLQEQQFDARTIALENPDVVIQEKLERLLMRDVPKSPPELKAFEPTESP